MVEYKDDMYCVILQAFTTLVIRGKDGREVINIALSEAEKQKLNFTVCDFSQSRKIENQEDLDMTLRGEFGAQLLGDK